MQIDIALRALNRFGLGARQGEGSGLGDPRDWLRAQLASRAADRPEQPGATSAELRRAIRERERIRQTPRELRRTMQDEQREARKELIAIGAREAESSLVHRVRSEAPFVERLVAFWSNHLCIATSSNPLVAALAGSYERQVIRAHVLGRYENMVLESARHPAMLLYLNNEQSAGPNSRAARRRTGFGLNENYARELLELHTLGVGGGYTQSDVIALARILTGWRSTGIVGAVEGPPGFKFNAAFHEPGQKVLLGVTYAEEGELEGARAIVALCRHASTAAFIAEKLVRHFVADVPPASAVDRIATVFRETEGDLLEVSRALIELPDAWTAEHRKFRTPQDWLIAVFRATGLEPGNRIANQSRQLRQPLWNPQSPKGFGDTLREWADPDSLLNRAELARTMARRVNLSHVTPIGLLGTSGAAGGAKSLRAILQRPATTPRDRIALVLASPVFQWRE